MHSHERFISHISAVRNLIRGSSGSNRQRACGEHLLPQNFGQHQPLRHQEARSFMTRLGSIRLESSLFGPNTAAKMLVAGSFDGVMANAEYFL